MAPAVPVGTLTPGLETPVRLPLAPYRLDQLGRLRFVAEQVVGVDSTPRPGRLEIVRTEGQ